MDILLAHGYFLKNDPHEMKVMKPYAPLGVLYISAYLKERGFSVGVFDSTFSSLEDFDSLLQNEKPSIVGLYTTLMTKPDILKMIRLCKAAGAWVVLGGPEPPHYAEEYLKRGADVVVIGEGEAALEELIPLLIQGKPLDEVTGIAFLDDSGAIIRTPPRLLLPNLDALPMPDREAIDLEQYLNAWKTNHGASSLNLVAARGCPYTCTWCSHSVYGESHRRTSPQKMADEALWLVERYQPDQFWYVDDVFTINHRWLRDYAAELKKRGVHVPFECISRADRLSEEIIDLLAEMGCKRLWIGSESGSQPILDAMQRKTDVSSVQQMTHALRKRGIETGMFIMIGYEGETPADLAATVDHLKAADPELFLTTVAYPIKGTAYYETVRDRVIEPGPWEAYTDRDLTVAGRHSRRYYSFATRWMVNAVRLHKLRGQDGFAKLPRLAKAAANMVVGRAGMALTHYETESAPAGRGWYDEKRKTPV
jgi:anaerobic magnesium-protoporphyrin IX monomethyl ester cyclase